MNTVAVLLLTVALDVSVLWDPRPAGENVTIYQVLTNAAPLGYVSGTNCTVTVSDVTAVTVRSVQASGAIGGPSDSLTLPGALPTPPDVWKVAAISRHGRNLQIAANWNYRPTNELTQAWCLWGSSDQKTWKRLAIVPRDNQQNPGAVVTVNGLPYFSVTSSNVYGESNLSAIKYAK